MNKVILCGNLAVDPELRYTQSQKAVASFRVATSEKDKVEYHNVVTWEKLADNCSKYLTKGKKVLVEGKLQTRSWEDKDGNKRYTTEIIAYNVEFLSPKSLETTVPSKPEEKTEEVSIDQIPF